MSSDDPAARVSSSAARERVWDVALLLLLLFECAPIWVFRHFPSQDGPSHLHNAFALAHSDLAIFRQYYEIHLFQPAGNILPQLFLAGLVQAAGPVGGGKVFLTLNLALFFIALRYFLRGITTQAGALACFGALLAPYWFLYIGFWNFSYSTCILLLVAGFCLRHRGQWTYRSLTVLALGGFAVYAAHVVSWVVCVAAAAVIELAPAVRHLDRRAIASSLKPVTCLLPPGFMVAWYLTGSQAELTCAADPSFLERLRTLIAFTSHYSVSDSDRILARVIVLFLGGIVIAAMTVVYRRGWLGAGAAVCLLLTATCGAMVLAGPDAIGQGCFIHRRVALYFWIFLFTGAAAAIAGWSPKVIRWLSGAACGIALVAFALRIPALAEWNSKLKALEEIGQYIPPESTALILNLHLPWGTVNPYQHAIGVLTARRVVDLGNYEAWTDHFPTRFRSEMSPFPLLGSPIDLEAVPPVFNVERYGRQSRGRVQYILFQGAWDFVKGENLMEGDLYPDQIASFRLVAVSPDRMLRLYRVPETAGSRPAD
jgi:hypothetical protein